MIVKYTLVLLLAILLRSGITLAQSEPDYRAAIQARFSNLQNLRCEFERTQEYTPAPEMVKAFEEARRKGGKIILLTGQDTAECSLSVLGNNVRFEEKPSGDSAAKEASNDPLGYVQQITLLGPERFETLRILHPGSPAAGAIYKKSHFPESPDVIVDTPRKGGEQRFPDDIIEQAVGLRFESSYANFQEVTPKIIEQMKLEKADGLIVLRQKILENDHVWYFDPSKKFSMIRYSITEQKSGRLLYDCTSSDFETIGALPLPKTCKAQEYSYQGRVIQTTSVKVHRYTLNDPRNQIGDYMMRWPDKANVLDERSGRSIKIKTKDQPLTDEEIAARISKDDEEKAGALQQAQERIERTQRP